MPFPDPLQRRHLLIAAGAALVPMVSRAQGARADWAAI